MKDQMDGLDIYVAAKSNYLYMYDRFIRDTFGMWNIAEIKYSDVVQFYNHLIEKQELDVAVD